MIDIHLKDQLLIQLVAKRTVDISLLRNIFNNDDLQIKAVASEFENMGLAEVSRVEQGVRILCLIRLAKAIPFYMNGGFAEIELQYKVKNEEAD
jgi:hypothetical protein